MWSVSRGRRRADGALAVVRQSSVLVFPAMVVISYWCAFGSERDYVKPPVPKPMEELYERHLRERPHPPPPAHLIRGIRPSNQGWMAGLTALEFRLPATEEGERLTAAELRLHARPAHGVPGAVAVAVSAWSGARRLDRGRRSLGSRPAWLPPLNVTAALPSDGTAVTSLAINVTLRGLLRLGEAPLLLLHYVPPDRTTINTTVGDALVPRRRRRRREAEEEGEAEEYIFCRRRPLYVDFEEIGLNWMIQPKGYQAYQCAGHCLLPMGAHLSPTKHAILQAMVHDHSPDRTHRPCCVATRLEPISVIYLNNDSVLTFDYTFQNMVVAECGCR